MTLDQRLEEYQATIDDLTFPTVKKWKTEHAGGKVVGMFPVYTPYELPHAAGMLPVGLYGAGGKVEIDHADSRIQSFVCSIARSTLELGLRDLTKDFDALWFTSICDVARNLSGVWETNFPSQAVRYIHYPQNMTSPAAPEHYRAELKELVAMLEEIGGARVTDDRLRRSITAYNEQRRLCRELYTIKEKHPWLLATWEAYLVVRIGTLIPVEEHVEILKAVIPEVRARKRPPRDYVRVLLEGSFCEQPPLELLRVLEESGCAIADDDLLMHTRWFTDDVPTDGDPLTALASAYIDKTRYSSVRHYGPRPRKEEFLKKIRDQKVDGVIFAAPKFCEPALLDYVLFKDELEKAGIAYLGFEYEEKMGVFESIRTQAETFVESVMFFS
jgi:benzoyl-CoA reductase subunit C